MKTKQNKFGVTLVELIIVIAIIAIMATAVYVVRKPADDKGKILQTKTTIELLCTALEQYHQFYNHFPFKANKDYGSSSLLVDVGGTGFSIVGNDHEPNYSSSEALYYFMNQLPDSQKIINSINSKLLTNRGKQGGKYFVTVNSTDVPLIRVVDAWGNALRYTYEKGDNFPLITSAGSDGLFDNTTEHPNATDDNITSK